MDFEQTQVINDLEENEEENENEEVAHLKVFSQQGFNGAVFPVFRGENVIGRSKTCNITILNETLSKKHACISVNAERNLHLIHDCQSTNGTKRGKSLLVPILRYELKHGDMLTFGILECQYLVGGDVHMFKSEEDETVSESDSDSVLPDLTVDLDVKKDGASEAGSGTESELANLDEDTKEALETSMDMRSEAGSETESESDGGSEGDSETESESALPQESAKDELEMNVDEASDCEAGSETGSESILPDASTNLMEELEIEKDEEDETSFETGSDTILKHITSEKDLDDDVDKGVDTASETGSDTTLQHITSKEDRDNDVESSPEMSQDCKWCSRPRFMRKLLPDYVNKPLCEWHEVLLDLCYCFNCVQEYHRLAEELIQQKSELKKNFQKLDIERLTQVITQALENAVDKKVFDPSLQDAVKRLQVHLTELLRYPYLLHRACLADLFIKGIITLNQCGSPLRLEEKLPGAYLLLVHPDIKVRAWAVRCVRDLGLISPDDFDLLANVVGWMINVVQFNLFENIDALSPENTDAELPFDFLPPHLFISLTRREYWLGLFVLLRQMDVSTVRTYFTNSTDHATFLGTVLSLMETEIREEGAFWPMLQCFVVLLERLENRIWQLSSLDFKPDALFNFITTHCVFTKYIQLWQDENELLCRQDDVHEISSRDFMRTEGVSSSHLSNGRFRNTALAWLYPFVQSLLDFDTGEDNISEVIRYLHNMAATCSLQNTFKQRVLSSLLNIIGHLLTKRSSLLLPTVRIWASDLVDVAVCGSVDSRLVDLTQRLLQQILQVDFPGPANLSPENKQQIISLLVQTFENQQLQTPEVTAPLKEMKFSQTNDLDSEFQQGNTDLALQSSRKRSGVSSSEDDSSEKEHSVPIKRSKKALQMKESATEEGNLVNIPRISKAMVAEGDDESTDECIDENWENKPKRMFKLESGTTSEQPVIVDVSNEENSKMPERQKSVLQELQTDIGDACSSNKNADEFDEESLLEMMGKPDSPSIECELNVRSGNHDGPTLDYVSIKEEFSNGMYGSDQKPFSSTLKSTVANSSNKNADEFDEESLLEMMDKPDSPSIECELNVRSGNHDGPTLDYVSIKEEYSNGMYGSDEKPFTSTLKSTVANSASPFDAFFHKAKVEAVENEFDTVLYPEMKDIAAKVGDDVNSGQSQPPPQALRFTQGRGATGDELQETMGRVHTVSRLPLRAERRLGTRQEQSGREVGATGFGDLQQDLPINVDATASACQMVQGGEQIGRDPSFKDDNYKGYSNLILNPHGDALSSLEEDLEDIYSTQSDIEEEINAIPRDTDVQAESVSRFCFNQFHEEAPGETHLSGKHVKHASFADDKSPIKHTFISAQQEPAAAITTPRKVLREEEFFRTILRLNVADLVYPERNGRAHAPPRGLPSVSGPVKTCFDSIDQYYDTFKPLFFLEIWEKISNRWRDKKVDKKQVDMEVLDGSTSNSIIPCSGSITDQQERKALFPIQRDLVVVNLIERGPTGVFRSSPGVFGIVETVDVKKADVCGKFRLTLNIRTASTFRPKRGSSLEVKFVASLLTALRSWRGMMYLSKSLLARHILKPHKAEYFCSSHHQYPAPESEEYNEFQAKAISIATNAVHMAFPIPRICMLQGPPGTGKSHTIVGIIKEILNRPQENHQPTASGPFVGHQASKVRILLCAPSNVAIDALIGQIEAARIHLDNENRRGCRQGQFKKALSNNCGDLFLVRVGRKHEILPSVLKFGLECLTKQVLDNELVSATAGQLAKNSSHDYYRDKKNLQIEKEALREKLREENAKQTRIRREILDSADIICTTLSGAGSESLKNDLQSDRRRICPFSCVIVDEACQTTELDLLIPLQYMASKLVLVGDPTQLPPTVLSTKVKENLFGRSMFERLDAHFRDQDWENTVIMLEEQYRMHPEIARFPSVHFYKSRLKSHSSLETRAFPLDRHYALFDVHRGEETGLEKGELWNPVEADMIADLCGHLVKVLDAKSIGVITPYRNQRSEIQKRLLTRGGATSVIEVEKVDCFQGREKDVIILSCVRTKTYHGSIGFVAEKRRMHVALTRARQSLFVFGDMETLKGVSEEWRALIEDAHERSCCYQVASSKDVQSVISLRNDRRSPAKDPRLHNKIVPRSQSSNRNVTDTNRRLHRENMSENQRASPALKNEGHLLITIASSEGEQTVRSITVTPGNDRRSPVRDHRLEDREDTIASSLRWDDTDVPETRRPSHRINMSEDQTASLASSNQGQMLITVVSSLEDTQPVRRFITAKNDRHSPFRDHRLERKNVASTKRLSDTNTPETRRPPYQVNMSEDQAVTSTLRKEHDGNERVSRHQDRSRSSRSRDRSRRSRSRDRAFGKGRSSWHRDYDANEGRSHHRKDNEKESRSSRRDHYEEEGRGGGGFSRHKERHEKRGSSPHKDRRKGKEGGASRYRSYDRRDDSLTQKQIYEKDSNLRNRDYSAKGSSSHAGRHHEIEGNSRHGYDHRKNKEICAATNAYSDDDHERSKESRSKGESYGARKFKRYHSDGIIGRPHRRTQSPTTKRQIFGNAVRDCGEEYKHQEEQMERDESTKKPRFDEPSISPHSTASVSVLKAASSFQESEVDCNRYSIQLGSREIGRSPTACDTFSANTISSNSAGTEMGTQNYVLTSVIENIRYYAPRYFGQHQRLEGAQSGRSTAKATTSHSPDRLLPPTSSSKTSETIALTHSRSPLSETSENTALNGSSRSATEARASTCMTSAGPFKREGAIIVPAGVSGSRTQTVPADITTSGFSRSSLERVANKATSVCSFSSSDREGIAMAGLQKSSSETATNTAQVNPPRSLPYIAEAIKSDCKNTAATVHTYQHPPKAFSTVISGQSVATAVPVLSNTRLCDPEHPSGRSAKNDELDPSAQKAANIVRQRHPPPAPIPIIPAVGPRRRVSRVNSNDAGVNTLRERASETATVQKRKDDNVTSPNKIDKKKLCESFRGRKSWN